jgi:DnaA family protein
MRVSMQTGNHKVFPGMNTQLPLGIQLRDDASFDNYLALANIQILQALQAVAAGRGEQFIYLWGTAGSGRTHLLQATVRAVADDNGTATYLPLRQFNDLDPAMLEGLETLGLVCVDDVQIIAGDADWEQALFHLFNRMRGTGAKLVISGDAAPTGLSLGLADLRSRLGGGLVFRLQPPCDDDKIGVLQLRARNRGLQLDDDVARYMLHHCPRDLPALFDLLERLDVASLAAKRRLTIPFIKHVLEQCDE